MAVTIEIKPEDKIFFLVKNDCCSSQMRQLIGKMSSAPDWTKVGPGSIKAMLERFPTREAFESAAEEIALSEKNSRLRAAYQRLSLLMYGTSNSSRAIPPRQE